MSFHRFKNEDGEEYGSFEVFQYTEVGESQYFNKTKPGWYWWACFPGCLPDGEPNGPFGSAEEAMKDARYGD